MADRYRAYDPASSHGRDPQVDYPGYIPSEITLPSYYPSQAPGIPGDYASRTPIPPGDYTSRTPIPPGDYTSRTPIPPGDYTSRTPIPPGDYTSRAPIPPGDYASRAPIPPGDYTSRAPIPPGDYTSRAPILPVYTSRAPVLPGGADILRNDVALQSQAYGLDGPAGVTNPALPDMSGLAAGARSLGPSPFEGSSLAGQSGLGPAKAQMEDPTLVRRSSPLGKSAGIADVEHHISLDGPSEDESNILFVDGLPSDCTRREVAHLFRPFVGFKDIKVVHKEPRRSGDKAYVLCFVEFENGKHAFTAMEALQEYRFDDRKPDAPVLKIHFARFPFRLPAAAKDDKKRTIKH